jgi:CRP-like cAMP-binding protein
MESATVSVLAGLDEAEIARLAAVCEESTLAAGEVAFREGDEGEDLFIVRRGLVRVSKAISLEVDRTLAIVGEGGVFGELAMVGEGARSATATAEAETVVLAFSREGFERLTEEAPGLGLKIMGRFAAMLAERLRLTTNLLRDTVQWGLEVSGAAALDLQGLVQSQATLTAQLVNGRTVTGRLLKVEKNEAGYALTMADEDDGVHLVPYHALVALEFSRTLLSEES